MSGTFISTTTSVFLADLRQQSKVIILPAASTAQGRSISIKDYYGNATQSSLRISTQGADRIETYSNFINFTQDFQCIEFTGIGNTNWSITNNYNGSLVTSQRGSTIFGIPNMSLWLDGSDQSTMTFSAVQGDLLSWRDKSSNGYTFLPVNSNVRSQASTNCIVLTASTSHFLSQQFVPATPQCDMFVVVNETSLRGPLTGIAQNADLMFLETDRRYHTQVFADGNQTFTTLTYTPTLATFFIFQGSLFANSDANGTIHQYNTLTSAFTLVATISSGTSTRGGAVMDGNVYFPTNGVFFRMNPAFTLANLSAPASNYASVVVFANQIFTQSLTSTYPVYSFTPATSTWSNVGSTNQNNGRLIVYNGVLYSVSSNTNTSFIQFYTGNGLNPWIPPFGLNYTSSIHPMVFSNSLVYGQCVLSRLIEFRPDTGCLYMASNSNIVSQAALTLCPVNYKGEIWTLPSRGVDANTVYVSFFSGKNQGTSGTSEFVQVNTQTFTYLNSAIVFDGSLFVGTNNAAIYRWGAGATVDMNISSISSSTGVNTYSRPRIAMIRKNATNLGLWVNGLQLSNRNINFTYSNQNQVPQQMYVGGLAGTINTYYSDPGRDHMEGALYEVINFTSTLQTSDRQKIEGYLAWKYNIQDVLPTGHPFLSAAPTS
jgi:hypothetical protein